MIIRNATINIDMADAENKELRKALLEYCDQDTLAMVRVLRNFGERK